MFCVTFFQSSENDKKDADLTSWQTADSLHAHWEPSYLPLMTRKNSKIKVKKLFDRFCVIRDARKDTVVHLTKKKEFLQDLETRLDISAEKAFDIIAADKTLSAKEKKEDTGFLLALRENRPHALGAS